MADIDTIAEIDGTGVGTLGVTFTVGSNSNRGLVAGTTWRQTGITLTSISGAGAAWTSLGARVNQNNQCVHTYKGIAPDTGSQTVTATYNDTFGANQHLGVYSCYNADQTTFASDLTTQASDTTAPTVTVPNVASGDLVVDFCRTVGGVTFTPGANQNSAWDNAQAVGQALGSYQAGADGGVMSWSWTLTGDTVLAGVRVINAAATGSLPRFLLLGVG